MSQSGLRKRVKWFSAFLGSSGTNNDKNVKGLTKEHIHELPLLSFSSIADATDNFSLANKLGEGGFGPVYKVCLISETQFYLNFFLSFVILQKTLCKMFILAIM